jgi:hypothetical protein
VLRNLSELSIHSYGSTEEAIGAVLELMHRMLGMSTPFVTHVHDGRLHVLASQAYGGCPLEPGTDVPLGDAY